jgi:hypothetical protein
MGLVPIVVGLGLLTLGRRLFWLFVGGVGFAFGASFAEPFAIGQPDWVVVSIALVSGLVGAMLAIYLQRFAVVVAGFFGGAETVVRLLHALHIHTGAGPWVSFVVGGLIGAMLLYVLFDWALIAMSSVVGASLIVQALRIAPSFTVVAHTMLVACGLAVQIRTLPRR